MIAIIPLTSSWAQLLIWMLFFSFVERFFNLTTFTVYLFIQYIKLFLFYLKKDRLQLSYLTL